MKDKTMSSGPSIPIGVKPLFPQGKQVFCEIIPPPGNAKSGMIRLDKGKACTLEFTLQAGNPSGLQFSGNGDAFCWDSDNCPGQNGTANAPYSSPTVGAGGSTLKVTVDAVPEASAVHYRLNFTDGQKDCHFDPVIIRD